MGNGTNFQEILSTMLFRLVCGVFKRHNNQLYKTDMKDNRKSVLFAPKLESRANISESSNQPKKPQLGYLVILNCPAILQLFQFRVPVPAVLLQY